MGRAGTAVQQMPSDPAAPARRDNLYEARADAQRGGQDVHARGSSVMLQIQKAPSRLFGIAAIGLGAAIFAIDRATASRRS